MFSLQSTSTEDADGNDGDPIHDDRRDSRFENVVSDSNGDWGEAMDAENSSPVSNLYGGAERDSGDIDFSSSSGAIGRSDGGLIGWRSLLGREQDSWGHPSPLSPPSIHIRVR